MAPTFVPGKAAKTLFNNVNMTQVLQNVTIEASAKALDTTVHGLDDETYIAGLRSGTAQFEGLFDGTAASTASTATTGAIDAKFHTALGASTQPIITFYPRGDALGRRARLFRGEQTKYAAMAPANDLVKTAADVQISGRQDFGVSLHALAARSSTSSTYGNVDSGYTAGTTGGGVGHLHVTSGSVAGLAVKIQHSSAATTGSTDGWADVISFSSFTESSGPTAAQRSTASGTIKRRVRAIVSSFSTASGSSTDATFAVAFARRGTRR